MKHLDQKMKEVILNSTNEERIRITKQFKWIGYTQALHTIKKMEDCLTRPKSHRMPNILLVGDSNNGKTAILARFVQMYPAYIEKSTD